MLKLSRQLQLQLVARASTQRHQDTPAAGPCRSCAGAGHGRCVASGLRVWGVASRAAHLLQGHVGAVQVQDMAIAQLLNAILQHGLPGGLCWVCPAAEGRRCLRQACSFPAASCWHQYMLRMLACTFPLPFPSHPPWHAMQAACLPWCLRRGGYIFWYT